MSEQNYDSQYESMENRAMDAFNKVFSAFGESVSMCARYVYNLAKTFVTGIGPKKGDGGKGNCGTRMYYDALVALGYTETKRGVVTKKTIVDEMKDPSMYPPGTVVAYQAKSGDKSKNAYKYGHTQFHLGNGKWTSSKKANYGCTFVYNSFPSDKWEYHVFLPPTPEANITEN